ncbi:MAG: glycosyl transferase family 2, partial [bacterium]
MRELCLYSYFFILLILSVFGFHRYYILRLYRKHRKDVKKPLDNFDVLPVVTIQLPMFNEKYVAERLIEIVSRIKYPSDKLEIQVLD